MSVADPFTPCRRTSSLGCRSLVLSAANGQGRERGEQRRMLTAVAVIKILPTRDAERHSSER